MTPKITLSLMVTNAEELATMLALLDHHTAGESDLAKQARVERDEAMTSAVGWKAAAEKRNEDYVTLAQHAESLADQVEAATNQLKAAQRTIAKLAAICPHPTFTVTDHQPICDTCGRVVELAEQMRTDAQQAFDATWKRRLTPQETDAFNAWAKRMDPANDLHPDEDTRA